MLPWFWCRLCGLFHRPSWPNWRARPGPANKNTRLCCFWGRSHRQICFLFMFFQSSPHILLSGFPSRAAFLWSLSLEHETTNCNRHMFISKQSIDQSTDLEQDKHHPSSCSSVYSWSPRSKKMCPAFFRMPRLFAIRIVSRSLRIRLPHRFGKPPRSQREGHTQRAAQRIKGSVSK